MPRLGLPPHRPAFAPRRPTSAAALLGTRGFCLNNYPVAILATMTAAPITSAGRFSPRRPLGIVSFHLGNERRDAGDLRSLFLRRVRPWMIASPNFAPLHAAKPLPIDGQLLFLRFAEINHEADLSWPAECNLVRSIRLRRCESQSGSTPP